MDTSKEYILMCQKAEEIQKLMPTEEKYKEEDLGSLYYYLNSDYLAILHEDNDTGWVLIGGYGETDYSNIVWLPRQDQLQEMLKQRFSLIYNMINEFYFWCEDNAGTYTWDLISGSMEQLWLTFVMHELYGKYWTGSEWR